MPSSSSRLFPADADSFLSAHDATDESTVRTPAMVPFGEDRTCNPRVMSSTSLRQKAGQSGTTLPQIECGTVKKRWNTSPTNISGGLECPSFPGWCGARPARRWRQEGAYCADLSNVSSVMSSSCSQPSPTKPESSSNRRSTSGPPALSPTSSCNLGKPNISRCGLWASTSPSL